MFRSTNDYLLASFTSTHATWLFPSQCYLLIRAMRVTGSSSPFFFFLSLVSLCGFVVFSLFFVSPYCNISASCVTVDRLFHSVVRLTYRVACWEGFGSQISLFQSPIYFSRSLMACHASAHRFPRLSSSPLLAATPPSDVQCWLVVFMRQRVDLTRLSILPVAHHLPLPLLELLFLEFWFYFYICIFLLHFYYFLWFFGFLVLLFRPLSPYIFIDLLVGRNLAFRCSYACLFIMGWLLVGFSVLTFFGVDVLVVLPLKVWECFLPKLLVLSLIAALSDRFDSLNGSGHFFFTHSRWFTYSLIAVPFFDCIKVVVWVTHLYFVFVIIPFPSFNREEEKKKKRGG